MLVFPNAKINLGLNIVEKRKDGFHNIETVFYPIPLQEALEIIPNSSKENHLSFSGIKIPNSTGGNLVERAHLLLKQDYHLPFVDIHLHKMIPIGAGLGGGSADGAFAIKALNDLFELKLSNKKMERYAAKLGSDCPFFIRNKAVYAQGKGGDFGSIKFSLEGKFLLLVYPNIHVSTSDAYANVLPKPSKINVCEVVQMPLEQWRNFLFNDFEKRVFLKFPEIEKIKSMLYDNGAIYASMSGSGSAVFGIYDAKPKFILPSEMLCWNLEL